MGTEGGDPEGVDSDIRVLLGLVAEEPIPEPRPDLVGRTLRRVRSMVVVRDLMAFATLESIWDGLRRGRAARAQSEDDRPSR